MFQLRPLLACEFLAHWVGGVSLPELGRLLGYTPRRLSDLIENEQKRSKKRTVAYDSTAKLHQTVVPTASLQGPQAPSAVVTVLQAAQLWNDGNGQDLLCPLADTREHRPQPAPDVFRTLLTACTRRQVVDLTYLAKTQLHSVLFSPHTLVITTHRVHFRGYSQFEQQGQWHWWDLVPSRVTHAEIHRHSGYVDDQNDAEWHEWVMLHLRLRDAVVLPTKTAIRHEHGMEGDRLRIGPVRRALLHYVAADYLERRYQGIEGPAWELTLPSEVPLI